MLVCGLTSVQFLSKLAAFVLALPEVAVLHFFLRLPAHGGSITRCGIAPVQLPLLVAVGREAEVKDL